VTKVKLNKVKWRSDVTDWLVSRIEFGKYGFNRDTLDPDYEYFEYWFIEPEDALIFRLTFPDTFTSSGMIWI